jgi:hypothetical protein
MDLYLVGVAWALVWNLQMKTKEKIGVIAAMGMGIL